MQHDFKFKREGSIGYLVHEVARLFRRRFEEEAKAHGITVPQWRALAEIAQNEGVSQRALALCIDIDPMTVSGILDRLEKRGLIERYPDPTDSRAKLARLTPAGDELVSIARNLGRAVSENALSGLTVDDREHLVAGLTRIRDNLNNMTAEQKETV